MINLTEQELKIVDRAVVSKKLCIAYDDGERRDAILFKIMQKLREDEMIDANAVLYPILYVVPSWKKEFFYKKYKDFLDKNNIKIYDKDCIMGDECDKYKAVFIDDISMDVNVYTNKRYRDVDKEIEKKLDRFIYNVKKANNDVRLYITCENCLCGGIINIYTILKVLGKESMKICR